MAGDSDDDNKTEQPTEKRRSETLEREGGPSSKEVGNAAALLVIALFLSTGATGLFGDLARVLAAFLENPGGWRLDNGEDAILLLQATSGVVVRFIGLFIAAIVVAGIAATVLQNPPRIIADRIMPDFSRVSLSAGFGRLFNVQSVIELLKGATKIGIAAIALYAAIGGASTALIAVHSAPGAIPELIRRLCLRIVFLCALMTCVVAAVDVFLTRRKWLQNLMMSKQEIKDEQKQMEGDLAFKARLRAIARARIRRRMMANVPKATVVVTNPTHYAIALRYVRKEDEAPKVLAKGQNNLALRIREIAELHNIPIVENKTLARSLFDAAQVDQLIPAEFYRAVAEIIIYLETKSRRRPRGPGAPKPTR
ncbi:MAG: flagellar type III secretion system protein FlhB [Rhodomicrobium sp.]